MRNRDDEEFELVLGNKQLISMFILVVVMFAAFFAFGYSMGVRRAGDEVLLAEASTLASVNPAEPAASAPSPSRPASTPDPAASTPAPATTQPAAATESTPASRPEPPPAKAAPKADPPKPTPAKTAPPKAAAPRPAPATSKSVGESVHLQIAAFRELGDANMLVDDLVKKGHKASVYNRGDEWRRVVVGPFPNVAAAKSYQNKLKTEGYESLLRNP